VKTKTCTLCKETKPLAPRFFYRSAATRDGYHARCADCSRASKTSFRRGAPIDAEFVLGDVWEVPVIGRDGKERVARFRVCSAGADPFRREIRVNGMVGRRRTTIRAAVLRTRGRLIERAEEARAS